MPSYHESSVEMMNKNSSGRVIVIGGEVYDDGKYAIKEVNTKYLVLLGVTNSKSYSWRMTMHLETQHCTQR